MKICGSDMRSIMSLLTKLGIVGVALQA
uniref:Uncharacterized protein n=1 Tax=Arundo donax TaxID=35708 RepID=A0A0A8YSQ3_ARUDO